MVIKNIIRTLLFSLFIFGNDLQAQPQDFNLEQANKGRDYLYKIVECLNSQDLEQAIYWGEEVLKIQEQYFAGDKPPQMMAYAALGISCYANEKYFKAQPFLENALELLYEMPEELVSEYETDVLPIKCSVLNALGELYRTFGFYSKAIPLYEEAALIGEYFWSKNSPQYAVTINNLASAYLSSGEYSKSESYYLEVIELNETNNILEGASYCSALNNLGNLYLNLGNYSKAENLFNKSLDNLANTDNWQKKIHSTILTNLGLLYSEKGDNAKAESYYLKALDSFENEKNDNSQFISLLSNMAELYRKQGLYEKAEQYSLRVVERRKILLGKDNPDYLQSLHNLAGLYLFTEQHFKAESLYLETVEGRKKVLGDNHPDYLNSLTSLARLYDYNQKPDVAKPYISEAFQKQKTNVQKNFNFLTGPERNLYWHNVKSGFEMSYPTFFLNLYPTDHESSKAFYDNALFCKGLLLSKSLHFRESVMQKGDENLLNLWDNFEQVNRKINWLYTKPLNQQEDLSKLQEESNKIEKQLLQSFPEYYEMKNANETGWKNISDKLKDNEAAIEFVSFRNHNYKGNAISYCALVLKKDSPNPMLIPLFEEQEFNDLFTGVINPSGIYSNTRADIDKSRLPESTINYDKHLYELIWEPIENYLDDINTIYYSPSGKLQQVSFAAIPVDENTVLIEKYNLRQVSSTKEILSHKDESGAIESVALFGGIEYNDTISAKDAVLTKNFQYLAGSITEVNNINQILIDNNIKSSLYCGHNASEKNFKELGGKYDIIHTATHGFYIPPHHATLQNYRYSAFYEDNIPIVIENSLLRSGLALSGANNAWNGNIIPDDDEDGILTAQEISSLNLSGTKLVVLSACETGLGDISGSEGVYGLQRAFKMAGVQSILMSLWPVPDNEISDLMQLFYSYWINNKMDKHEAFRKAQIELKNKNISAITWAGFVMID